MSFRLLVLALFSLVYNNLFWHTLAIAETKAFEEENVRVTTYGPFYDAIKLTSGLIIIGSIQMNATFIVEIQNNTKTNDLRMDDLHFVYYSSFGKFPGKIDLIDLPNIPPENKLVLGITRRIKATIATYHGTYTKLEKGQSLTRKDIALEGAVKFRTLDKDSGKLSDRKFRHIGEQRDLDVRDNAEYANTKQIKEIDQLPEVDFWL